MSIASVVMSPYKRLPDQEMEPLSQNPSILSSLKKSLRTALPTSVHPPISIYSHLLSYPGLKLWSNH